MHARRCRCQSRFTVVTTKVPAAPSSEMSKNKRKHLTRPKPNKNKRFTEATSSLTSRRGGASYAETPLQFARPILMAPRLNIFPVFVSNNGSLQLCKRVYECIQVHDNRLSQSITPLQLTYVTVSAYTYRVCSVARRNGYVLGIEGYSVLK